MGDIGRDIWYTATEKNTDNANSKRKLKQLKQFITFELALTYGRLCLHTYFARWPTGAGSMPSSQSKLCPTRHSGVGPGSTLNPNCAGQGTLQPVPFPRTCDFQPEEDDTPNTRVQTVANTERQGRARTSTIQVQGKTARPPTPAPHEKNGGWGSLVRGWI